jgi:hypothetical protein
MPIYNFVFVYCKFTKWFEARGIQVPFARNVSLMLSNMANLLPVSIATSLQLLLATSASDAPTQRRSMVHQSLVSSASKSVLLIVRMKTRRR